LENVQHHVRFMPPELHGLRLSFSQGRLGIGRSRAIPENLRHPYGNWIKKLGKSPYNLTGEDSDQHSSYHIRGVVHAYINPRKHHNDSNSGKAPTQPLLLVPPRCGREAEAAGNVIAGERRVATVRHELSEGTLVHDCKGARPEPNMSNHHIDTQCEDTGKTGDKQCVPIVNVPLRQNKPAGDEEHCVDFQGILGKENHGDIQQVHVSSQAVNSMVDRQIKRIDKSSVKHLLTPCNCDYRIKDAGSAKKVHRFVNFFQVFGVLGFENTERGGDLGHLSSFAIQWIQNGGYVGVFFAMVLESACIPLPSEMIMPFGGYLAWLGHLHLWLVIVLGVLGNVVGSLVAYYIGKWGGRAVWLHYGRYVHVTERHLNMAENWFERRGEWAVFIGRLLPGIRTFISLPAGIANMNMAKFVLYSAIGSMPWVALLGYAGYALGQNWESIKHYTHPLTYVAILLPVGVVVAAVVRIRRKSTQVGR